MMEKLPDSDLDQSKRRQPEIKLCEMMEIMTSRRLFCGGNRLHFVYPSISP